MGASRKLQGEIDRVLEKVQEGVDVFDSIWNKVYDTDNANQKEKFEADLKKEIKKLQRYRDQIKTWIQSSEIKDKKVSASYEQALMDARKQIEREMERFKICEKETKTKAFSKEGLGQQPKTDPKEKAKSETRDWLNNVVSELESQIDSFEAEMEGLTVKKGKTRPPRLTHLEASITRHKAHIMKLELILRLLDNDELSPDQVNDVKDFLDDYVERNQEDFEEFSDVDELYISLPLEKVESLEDLVTIPPGLVKASDGIPILEVYSISYLGSSPLKAEDQIGSISLTTNDIRYDLYHQSKVDKSKPSIKYGDQLPMMDVGPICSFTKLKLKFNVSDKYKGSEYLSSHSPNDGNWLAKLSMKSIDGYERNISALFGCFSNAMVANLKVMLSPSACSSDATTNIYGVVLASNSKFDRPSCTSYLFSQNFASRIQVGHNDLIPLSKSRLGVPLDSQFYVDISLCCDGVPYEGTAEFIPNIKKVDSKVVAGKIKVEVTWNCGEYIYSTDEDSDFTDEDLDFTDEDSDELDSWYEYEYSMSDIEKEISETSLEEPYYEKQKSYD